MTKKIELVPTTAEQSAEHAVPRLLHHPVCLAFCDEIIYPPFYSYPIEPYGSFWDTLSFKCSTYLRCSATTNSAYTDVHNIIGRPHSINM